MAPVSRKINAERVEAKIRSLQDLGGHLRSIRKAGKQIVLCHGVFDLIHLGHIRHFAAAKKFGDVLVVTVTADKYVKRGPGRPTFNEKMRAEALAHLNVVDYVAIVDSPTAVEAIKIIKPNVLVKGSDHKQKGTQLPEEMADEVAAIKSVRGRIKFTDDITFSSSQLLNAFFETFPEATVRYLKRLSSQYSMETIQKYLRKAQALKVLVVGDAIIDQYHYTAPRGKSSKEGLVVHKYLAEEDFAGGALATANHVAQVCDKVDLVTVLGRKNPYEKFIKDKLDPRIREKFFFRHDTCTTIKRRYVNQDDHRKLFEVCFYDDSPLDELDEKPLRQFLEKNLRKYDLVVVNDFGHGMISKSIMKLLCSRSKKLALNVQTNSLNHGFNLVTKYSRANIVCIDEQEMRLATHDKHSELTVLMKKIATELKADHVIVTRGPSGSISYSRKGGFGRTPSLAMHGVDKVGAGDAFFSFVSPCYAAGVPQDLLGFFGNSVGALAIQIVGNRAPVQNVELLKFMTRLLKV